MMNTKIQTVNEYNQQYRANTKLKVIEYYGGECCWPDCHITEPILLTIDHVNNDGSICRREGIGRGYQLYAWLIRNNFPSDFQLLCWNHQHLKQLEFSKTKWLHTDNALLYREKYRSLRLEILNHYGNYCQCCGESNIDLLTIDHIGGGGRKQLKDLGLKSGRHFYRWLKNNNFPLGFRTLCWNCNCGRILVSNLGPDRGKYIGICFG